jgi:hypothetical protein
MKSLQYQLRGLCLRELTILIVGVPRVAEDLTRDDFVQTRRRLGNCNQPISDMGCCPSGSKAIVAPLRISRASLTGSKG